MAYRLFSSILVVHAVSEPMDCGPGVPLCGVLTLESGYGDGYYAHSAPAVHGLWPETDQYGNSQCIAPTDPTDPEQVYACYQSNDMDQSLAFQTHEWDKHGSCAGVTDGADYFNQICSLATAPLQVMADVRLAQPGNFEAMKVALVDAGYEIFGESDQQEVLISACANYDGRWKLVHVADFPSVCQDNSPAPPSPPSPLPNEQCSAGVRGPGCSSNADCDGVDGCLRCAGSGYCTDVPLPTPSPAPTNAQCVPGQRGPQCSSNAECDGVEHCVRCANSGYCTDVPLVWEI